MRATNLELVAEGSADFHAKLVCIGLSRLWMQRSDSNAGGIARGSMLSGRAGILFSLQQGYALNGVALQEGRIVRYAPAQEFWTRAAAGSLSWAGIGLSVEDLAAAAAACNRASLASASGLGSVISPPRGGVGSWSASAAPKGGIEAWACEIDQSMPRYR